MGRVIVIFLSFIVSSFLFAQTYSFHTKSYHLEFLQDGSYLNEKEKVIKVKKSFFVKLQEKDALATLLKKYNLQLLKKYSSQLYLLQTDAKDILQLIQQIDKDSLTLYAIPNFYKQSTLR